MGKGGVSVNTEAMFSSESSEWSTPEDFFKQLDAEFHFTLDPCATPESAKCEKYFTKEDDGLEQDWGCATVFCNPPYGNEIGKWVRKALLSSFRGATIVCLLPARTDTKWFHRYIYNRAEVRFIEGRLKFGGSKNSAPFPSMVVVFRGVK